METKRVRSTVSILRTVLHLLEDDPAIDANSQTALEFRRAALKLIAEIQTEHGITEELGMSSVDLATHDSPFKTIEDHR